MTKEELTFFTGQQGQKAYVAVNGKVYDVTESSYWREGKHLDVHQAGRDLSAELLVAPHVRSLIERFPVVAELEAAPLERPKATGSKVGIVVGVLLAGVLVAWLVLR